MPHDQYPDSLIRSVLEDVKTVAVIGASANPVRPSYFVQKYMIDKGYTVYPVNPGQAGKTILDRPCFASLSEVPEPIDMVDIFRASDAVPGIVEEALRLTPLPGVIWMQLGVVHEEAAARAEAAGLRVIMNRCPKIEYGRLSGEIGWTGVNSRTISSKRPVLRSGFQHRGLRR
ncbi:CoA-binding protein [Breoghania sp.]|uniref:CoA-binding protein n=1 Tax=Breoghania sp. TaxID=2065378 RepID=UPI0029CA1624|nr:CoA-binding protein [Breoghania sp.]